MKISFKEELFKFSQKKLPIYGVVILVGLMLYTTLTEPITNELIILGFGFGQWIFIILMAVGSEFIALEYKENTMMTLFYKHSKKRDVYLSKFVVLVLYALSLLVVGLIFTFLLKQLFADQYRWLFIYKGTYSLMISLILNMLGTLLYIFFTIALSFFLISLTKINGLVITIGLLIGFNGASISTAIMQNFPSIVPIFKWNPLNMIYIVNQLPSSTYITYSFLENYQIILGTLLYTLLFLISGFFLFKRRRI